MIIGHKQKVYNQPPPALEFDKFLKIRSEMQSIIGSQFQPITQKVQGFQQLLRLTKTGDSICAQTSDKRYPNSQLKNKSESSQTINVIGGIFSPNLNHVSQFNKFAEDFKKGEAQLKKFNKKGYEITEQVECREKDSFYVPIKDQYPKTSHEKKRPYNSINKELRNNKSSQEIIRERKKQAYTSCNGKKFRKFYKPLRNHESMSELNRINADFIKISAKLNYPPALLNCNLFEQNSNHFKQIKNKIKVFQAKTVKQYGVKLDSPSLMKDKKKGVCDDLNQNSEKKQNKELSLSDLQLAPFLAKEFLNRQQSYNQNLAAQQFSVNDTFIPKNLMEIVHSNGQRFHNINLTNSNLTSLPSSLKRGKMKKGYFYRPKSFKSTFTYIKI